MTKKGVKLSKKCGKIKMRKAFRIFNNEHYGASVFSPISDCSGDRLTYAVALRGSPSFLFNYGENNAKKGMKENRK